MLSKLKNLLIVPMIFMQLFAMPSLALAVDNGGSPGNIIPTCNQDIYGEGHTPISQIGQFEDPCDFEDFIQLIRNVIRFIVLYLTLPALVLAIAWAGFLILTSGGNAGKRTEAKDVLLKVVMGLIFMIGAWFIVEMIYSGLGYGGFLQFT